MHAFGVSFIVFRFNKKKKKRIVIILSRVQHNDDQVNRQNVKTVKVELTHILIC